ncbi:ribbon-helix-helix protein, CopG family [Paraburkholderia sp. EG304]|uniref:ribbon-helix-helix protein, CopG family n=1 Tax=Paraburkholderia sp. EG304 TaxID=3237015 RepID=UPI00397D7F97
MTTKKSAESRENGTTNQPSVEEDEGPRIKISITVPQEVLDRIDAYRRRRGGLNRSALFALAADWFIDEHPLKQH